MVTPIFCCGAECGVLSTAVHFSSGAGGETIDTTTFRTGARAFRCNPTANKEAVLTIALASASRWVGRAYFRFATLPSADCNLVCNSFFDVGPSVRFKSSDSKIYAAVSTTFGASGVSVTTGQWYRIDFDFNLASGANDTADVQVDGSACGQAVLTDATGAYTQLAFGALSTVTADVYVDDVILSQTAADYPIGAGFVKSYIPNADGSHNVAGANDFERSATGTDITNATTDAYTLIDDRPIKSGTIAEYINGIAPPNSTDYVEWQYEDSTEADAPRAVEALLALSDAATAGANDATITLREHAGGTSANIFTGDIGAASAGAVVYKRAHFATVPGTATAWSTTTFNALRSRFLVTDAAPDPYVASAMLEAEFPEAAVAAEASKYWRRTGNVPGMNPNKGHAISFGRSWAMLGGAS